MALTPAEKQAAYRGRQAAEIEKLQAAYGRVSKLEGQIVMLNAYILVLEGHIRTLQERKKPEANSSASKNITSSEYKLLRGLLHPDRHPDEQEKYNRAFEIFNRISEPKT